MRGDDMSRITPIDPSTTTGATRQMLDAIQAALGTIPNLAKTFAVAPATLKGYLDFNDALGTGMLDRRFREQIAIAVAEANACGYCLAAHHVVGARAGLS